MTVPALQHLTTDPPLTVEDRAADGASPRRLTMRLLRWDDPANTPQGRELFRRGAFEGIDPASVVIESERHGGALVGRGESYEDRDDGPYLTARIADTSSGRDIIELVREGIARAVSISFQPVTTEQGSDGVLHRARASLRRVAILPNGAYDGAEVLEMRGNPDMSDTATTTQGAQDAAQAPAAPPVDVQPILDRMDRLDASIAAVQAAGVHGTTQAPSAYPALDRHASFGEAWLAATEDPDTRAELHRVLADQVTGDNPGLVPPAYLSTIVGLVARARRGIVAFGGAAPLPASGMTLTWPKVSDTTHLIPHDQIVGAQATEKSEIVSSKVSFDNGTAAVGTWAGGSDVSWQLIRRSAPAYRDAYLRYLTNVWSMVTDAAFIAALETGAALTPTYNAATDTDGSGLAAALFSASVGIEADAGQPANVLLAASDVFEKVGAIPGLVPPAYGTQNVAGTAQASNLSVNVSGLQMIHEPHLSSGKMLLGVQEAATWHEDGSPFVAEADDVARLGTNVAVWSMGAAAVYNPEALALFTVTLA